MGGREELFGLLETLEKDSVKKKQIMYHHGVQHTCEAHARGICSGWNSLQSDANVINHALAFIPEPSFYSTHFGQYQFRKQLNSLLSGKYDLKQNVKKKINLGI